MNFAITGHLSITTMHTSNATTAIFRLERLGINRGIMADSIIGIVAQKLLKKLCPHVKKMKNALRGSDLSTVESIAHKMKGSGESYGFKKISQLGQQIKRSAQEKDHKKTKRLLEDFEDYLSNLFASMNQ